MYQNKTITIGDRLIGKGQKPFIVAEMSGNHNQSLERALSIIDAAAEAGADAVKIQTYTADTMTIKADHGLFRIEDTQSLWSGQTLYDLYEKAHTPWDWHKPMFEHACKQGIMIFSSPFDDTAVDFLESLDVPAYKIASFENTDHELLKKVAATGKPVIMSTGLSTLADLDESVRVLRKHGCKDLVLLKCTSNYPAPFENANIRTLPHLAEMFKDVLVGLSDHTLGIGVALGAVALEARMIEKHFTLDRSEGGVDSAFSLEPHELMALVEESDRVFRALGSIQYEVQEAEQKNLRFKRSIYVVQDMEPGEIFTTKNIRVIRPGDGLAPKNLETVLGKKANKHIWRGSPLDWDDIS